MIPDEPERPAAAAINKKARHRIVGQSSESIKTIPCNEWPSRAKEEVYHNNRQHPRIYADRRGKIKSIAST
jgi:hypothetical protein